MRKILGLLTVIATACGSPPAEIESDVRTVAIADPAPCAISEADLRNTAGAPCQFIPAGDGRIYVYNCGTAEQVNWLVDAHGCVVTSRP